MNDLNKISDFFFKNLIVFIFILVQTFPVTHLHIILIGPVFVDIYLSKGRIKGKLIKCLETLVKK